MTCEKIRYETRAIAKAAARRTRGSGGRSCRAYFCPECEFWHTTSQTATQRQRRIYDPQDNREPRAS